MNIIYSGYELSGVGKIANFFAEHKVIFGEVQFARFLLVLQLGSLGLFICRFIPHPRSITVTWKNRSGFFSYRPLSLETGGGGFGSVAAGGVTISIVTLPTFRFRLFEKCRWKCDTRPFSEVLRANKFYGLWRREPWGYCRVLPCKLPDPFGKLQSVKGQLAHFELGGF